MSKSTLDNSMNPASLPLIIAIGVAPFVGMANKLDVALFFSLIAFVVVVLTATLLHVMRDFIQDRYLPAFAMLIAAFWVSIAELILRLTEPEILEALSLYLPVLAVSPLVLVQFRLVESNENLGSLVKASFTMMGLFFGLMVGVSVVRELIGSGTLSLYSFGVDHVSLVVPGISREPLAVVGGASGAFILLGAIVALRNWVKARSGEKPESDVEKDKA